MIRRSKEEELARSLYTIMNTENRGINKEILKSTLFKILKIPPQNSSRPQTININNKYEQLYRNKMLYMNNVKTD